MDHPEFITAVLTNEIAERLPIKLPLIEMWEDSALDAWEEAEEKALWLAENLADHLVILRTGMPIFPACDHWACEYYDAMYTLILVPVDVWNAYKTELLAANEALLRQRSQCQHPEMSPTI